MGAEPYEYTVPYEPDIQAALDKLRRCVFESYVILYDGDEPKGIYFAGYSFD